MNWTMLVEEDASTYPKSGEQVEIELADGRKCPGTWFSTTGWTYLGHIVPPTKPKSWRYHKYTRD